MSQQCLRLHITQRQHFGSSPLLVSARLRWFLVQGLHRLLCKPHAPGAGVPPVPAWVSPELLGPSSVRKSGPGVGEESCRAHPGLGLLSSPLKRAIVRKACWFIDDGDAIKRISETEFPNCLVA